MEGVQLLQTERFSRMNYAVNVCGLIIMAVYTVLLYAPNSPETMLIRFVLFTLGLNGLILAICALLYFPPLHSVLRSKHKGEATYIT